MEDWQIQDGNGIESKCYALEANSYVKEAVRIAKARMSEHKISKRGLLFQIKKKKKASMPFTSQDYWPELDSSEYCDETFHTLYQNFIGMLRWICELGRVDILHETSLLSQYMTQPRVGHFKQEIHIFQYVESHDRSFMVMDPTRFNIIWTP